MQTTEPISYVTFDSETRALTGGYLQAVLPEHEGQYLAVSDAVRIDWPMYRLNEAGDGVELLPAPDPDTLPPAVVPQRVTRRQARQALLIAGLLDDVPVAIAALDDGTPEGHQQMRLAQIEWEDSLEFERSRPLVIQIGEALGLDAEALDQMFVTAATL